MINDSDFAPQSYSHLKGFLIKLQQNVVFDC
jgi:hypothetical protein